MISRFSKIKKVLKWKTPVLVSAYMAWLGFREIKNIQKIYGKNVHIIFMRGATGDTYLQLMILQNYLKEKEIGMYVILGDSAGSRSIIKLFPYQYKQISGYKASCIQKAYMLLGSEYLNITIMFPWDYGLYFNRCRVRMLERFNFMDTYKWYVLNLKKEILFTKPIFKKMSKEFIFEMSKKGVIKNKTIIISPDANSVTKLPVLFWNDLISDFKEKGYFVFVNCNYASPFKAPDIFFNYEESVPLLEYCGYFVGIRSGLCDIISTAKCKKIFIYPQKDKKINYSEHRSEIEFSGFKVMGLTSSDDNTTIEISTPLIMNITQTECRLETIDQYYSAFKLLRERILKEF